MSPANLEYFTIEEAVKIPIGLSLFGRAPAPDTPWPQPGEVIELRGPNAANIQVQILSVEQSILDIPGANPAVRTVLISRDSVQNASLAGFHVAACPKVSYAMQQQLERQSAEANSRQIPTLLWRLVGILAGAIVAFMLYLR
jgi:hypothetical protein